MAPDAPLLEAAAVQRAYQTPRGRLHAVAGVDLVVHAGEAVALVGESGSGKSTLSRMLIGLEAPDAGAVRFRGLDLRADRRRALPLVREQVSMVFQDPYASLDPRLAVGRIVEEPLIVHGRGDRAARRARVAELLDAVGLDPELAGRRARALSGGQRQRVAIARAVALEPALVILDEPVSALDVSVQAQVLNLLADLRERLGLAYLFVSHDLAVVRHVADRVAVMQLGRIVEEGPTEAVFAAPAHPYTMALLSSAMELGETGERIVLEGDPPSPLRPPSGCRFRTRCFRAEPRCAAEDPQLQDQSGRSVACHFPGALVAAGTSSRSEEGFR